MNLKPSCLRWYAFVLCTSCYTFYACSTSQPAASTFSEKQSREEINLLLDSFNRAAAKADYNAYFNFYADGAIFTGTDVTERWDKKEFMAWAKPFFDRGRAWNFTALERHIYFDKTGNTAWFDELLNTQMKICRGSGVLLKQGKEWKLTQYILSATIPNDQMNAVIKLKATQEDSIINKLLHQ